MKKRLFICCISAIFTLLCACEKNNLPISKTGFYFDTVISVTLYDSSDEALLDNCFEMASFYESIFSRTLEGSDIYRINNADGAPTEVNSETAKLLAKALEYAKLTEGKVDPTIGAVSSLWDFHTNTIPSQSSIEEALTHVNYKNIKITENVVTLSDPEAVIDLGFIAKGYIADKLKEYLVSEGITSAVINLGGNVLAIGSKPDSSPFSIGIQEPFAQSGTAAAIVSINDRSVVTSGVYERCFKVEDTLYHHILNPADGYPVQTDLYGVSIISDSSVDGDALSTACLILGYEKAASLINSFDNIEAIFITSDGGIHKTY